MIIIEGAGPDAVALETRDEMALAAHAVEVSGVWRSSNVAQQLATRLLQASAARSFAPATLSREELEVLREGLAGAARRNNLRHLEEDERETLAGILTALNAA